MISGLQALLDAERHPHASFLIHLLLVVGAYQVLRPLLFRTARLSESDYFKPTLVQSLAARPRRALLLASMCALAASGWKGTAWPALECGAALRAFVFTLCMTLAWFCSCYPRNHYFKRTHSLDRALVLLGALGTWLHPALVCGFVPLALLTASQFERPIPRQYRWTHKLPLFEALILFIGYLLVCRITGYRGAGPFLVAASASFAAHYFWSGAMKLPLRWLKHDDLGLLFIAAYDNGWCGSLSEERALRTARRLKGANRIIKPLTLALELGAVVAFLDPALAALFCLGWCLMHAGIFAASGIFFWMWMVLDLALANLWLDGRAITGGTETMRWLAPACSGALIVLARWIWTPKRLAWLDTSLSGVYRFFGVGPDGEAREISPRQCAPYDFPFAQGRFHYLNPEPNLVDVYGKVKKVKSYEEVMGVRSAADLEALKRLRPPRKRKEKRARRFDRFLRGFFRNKLDSKSGGLLRFLGRLASPPSDVYAFHVTRVRWDGREPLRSIRVHYVETCTDGRSRTVLSDRLIREVDLMEGAAEVKG